MGKPRTKASSSSSPSSSRGSPKVKESKKPSENINPEQIVASAVDDANQTNAFMGSKPKKLKPEIRSGLVEAVRSGNPATILTYIKSNKKKFPSAVFATIVMNNIRKSLE